MANQQPLSHDPHGNERASAEQTLDQGMHYVDVDEMDDGVMGDDFDRDALDRSDEADDAFHFDEDEALSADDDDGEQQDSAEQVAPVRRKLIWDKRRTRELFKRYHEQGDEEARELLITSHMNLVRFLAYKFKNRGEPIEDLIQVGTIGLIKAIDRFDLSRGLEFTTYATPTILGEIKRHFRDKGWSVRVPRRLQELSAKVTKATDALTQELQRTPTIDELAQYLEVTVDEVLEAMESGEAYSSVSLDSDSSGDDDAPSLLDRYGERDQRLDTSDDRMLIARTLSSFTPKEQEVIELRFLQGLTQIEIAERMGISQVQVSRLLRRTLKRMQEKIDPAGKLDTADILKH